MLFFVLRLSLYFSLGSILYFLEISNIYIHTTAFLVPWVVVAVVVVGRGGEIRREGTQAVSSPLAPREARNRMNRWSKRGKGPRQGPEARRADVILALPFRGSFGRPRALLAWPRPFGSPSGPSPWGHEEDPGMARLNNERQPCTPNMCFYFYFERLIGGGHPVAPFGLYSACAPV